jgi:hypothetical protein
MGGNYAAPLPPVQYPLGDQRVGIECLEIRALPKMLPPGTCHLERAILPPAPLDRA